MLPTTTTLPAREFSGRRLIVAGLVGGAIAAVLNVMLWAGARAAGVTMTGQFDPAAPSSSLPVAIVIVASVVPALVATGILATMNRLLARAGRMFAGLAAVGLLFSSGGPMTLAGADGATKVTLTLMHLVAAVAIAGALLKLGRRAS